MQSTYPRNLKTEISCILDFHHIAHQKPCIAANGYKFNVIKIVYIVQPVNTPNTAKQFGCMQTKPGN